jgi:hypothetical protein
MRLEAILLILAALFCARAALAQPAAGGAPADPLATLRDGHPRLILTEQRLTELRELERSDELLARCRRDVLARAQKQLDADPLVYEKKGPRLLKVSRDGLDRVYTLALAWRLTGEDKYAEAAKRNLLAVCEFKDWNPSHFLDTAEMAHAVGVGYDWLHAWLDEPTRATLREALVDKGLRPGLAGYHSKGRPGWWHRSEYNWNQVCNGGLLIGALAVADERPELAREIVHRAVATLPRALESYEPDGAWAEGPGYWDYATRYTAYALAALETALGTDFGLSERRGLRRTGFFPLYMTGPTGEPFNFADAGSSSRRRNTPVLLYLARRYDEPTFAAAERAIIRERGARTMDYVWYGPVEGEPAKLELDKRFEGKGEVVVMRSAWDDPNALFLGVKAGANRVNHAHLDLGSFVLDALGVRWARELGRDNYNLPGYWDKGEGGRRWDYYRLGTRSHNVPLVNGRNQRVAGVATFAEFGDGRAVVELTSAYREPAVHVWREVALVEGRRAVETRDRFLLREPCEITWGMTTDAEIETTDDGRAVLTLDGRRLEAEILAPAAATFSEESAEREPPQARNEGVRRLVIRLPSDMGRLDLAVRLSPVWESR